MAVSGHMRGNGVERGETAEKIGGGRKYSCAGKGVYNVDACPVGRVVADPVRCVYRWLWEGEHTARERELGNEKVLEASTYSRILFGVVFMCGSICVHLIPGMDKRTLAARCGIKFGV